MIVGAPSFHYRDLTMQKFGDSGVFQIECVHEPVPNAHGQIFGRMCLRFDSAVLGDIDEPMCMLNVTAGHLKDVLDGLDTRVEPELFALTDKQLWGRLDTALYLDDERTHEEIAADSARYARFDFLTNGGESFDRSKSFIVTSPSHLRILFKNDDQPSIGRKVSRTVFAEVLQEFLEWLNLEELLANVKTH